MQNQAPGVSLWGWAGRRRSPVMDRTFTRKLQGRPNHPYIGMIGANNLTEQDLVAVHCRSQAEQRIRNEVGQRGARALQSSIDALSPSTRTMRDCSSGRVNARVESKHGTTKVCAGLCVPLHEHAVPKKPTTRYSGVATLCQALALANGSQLQRRSTIADACAHRAIGSP